MASFQELAQGYAKRIKQAITSDNFNRFRILTQDLRYSKTLREAKAIKSEIDSLVYSESNKPIGEDDKRKIIELIDQELGLVRKSQKGYHLVEAASNDDLSDLADEIENILGGRK